MNQDNEEKQWVFCPICGAKTRVKLLKDTELKDFPLFCPKCKQESRINAKKFKVEVLASSNNRPDAKTQCRL